MLLKFKSYPWLAKVWMVFWFGNYHILPSFGFVTFSNAQIFGGTFIACYIWNPTYASVCLGLPNMHKTAARYAFCTGHLDMNVCVYSIYIYRYVLVCMVGAKILERKLRSTKARLFTVPCCSIILFSSESMKKKLILTYSYFLHRSIILVCSIIVFSTNFPHLPLLFYNYFFRSIINCA
jgi:hypothetical protein